MQKSEIFFLTKKKTHSDFQCKIPRFFFGRKKISDFGDCFLHEKKISDFQGKNPRIFLDEKKKTLGFSVQKSVIFFLPKKKTRIFSAKIQDFF